MLFSFDDFILLYKCRESARKIKKLQDVLTLTDTNKWYSVELQNKVIK